MPPAGIVGKEVELLSQWIANGAPWPASDAPMANTGGEGVNWQNLGKITGLSEMKRPDLPAVGQQWPIQC